MNERLRGLASEPLLHFLLLGGLVFWLGSRNAGPPVARDDVVEIDAGQIERLRSAWLMQWRRPPTERELRGLIEARVREEILYREAVALGLDRDDTIVRRRLAQKMEFLSEDTARLVDPDEEDLAAYLAEHPERYEEPPVVSFEHVFLSVDRRGDAATRDALALLTGLQNGSLTESAGLGDRFMLQRRYARLDRREIGERFGPPFADALFELPVGEWSGPVESGFGIHLVRILEQRDAIAPTLDAVRERVEQDWRSAQREKSNRELFEGLRSRYRVEVDEEAITAALSAGAGS